ncbi:MAG: hypothetical protein E4G99_10215 [Anaerolineales bacterium]|nr:MAG: hypothetical protein E4G99_10215 [Anaerolineales bacterium]
MLPFIVIIAATLYFLIVRSGIFDDLRSQPGKTRRGWGVRLLRELERDPELNQRLEVFKDFLETQSDDEDQPPQG